MKRWLVILSLLSVLATVPLQACGNSRNSASGGPVTIGALAPWSGDSAFVGPTYIDPVLQLVEKQVKDAGGILGGRQVDFIKFDTRSVTADAASGAMKLLFSDKVSVILYGGVSEGEIAAASDFAEKNGVLIVTARDVSGGSSLRFQVNADPGQKEQAAAFTSLTTGLHAKTVAILARDESGLRAEIKTYKAQLDAAGISTVCEGYYAQGTTYFTPYLSKIKFSRPDVVVLDLGNTREAAAIADQIEGLGGWGTATAIASYAGEAAAGHAGGQGWYVTALYAPGIEDRYPGAAGFVADYRAMFGRMPDSTDVFWYLPVWTAIKAVELAGTTGDHAKIAEAARSGSLTWDSPLGPARFTPDGSSNLSYVITHIVDGKLVPVAIPQ